MRPARPSDAAELAHLCGQLGYPTTEAQIEERFPELLGRPDHHVAVAVDGGDRATGFVHAVIRRQLETEPFVQIVVLVVGENQRGAGVGLALLTEAEQWTRRAGFTLVRLGSNVVRERAHQFYLRHGYSRIKTSYIFGKRLA